MTLAQFSMVEELASLVKDNYPCKHLILSVEDLLVNYLQDDTSLDGVLELEPMNSYSRLLVHRLAEIFGPGILVSDLLLQYGEMQTPMTCDVLRRKEVLPPDQKVDPVSGPSLDERETAYFAARERIFSEDACDSKLVKERPKKDPVVARRMITRALGQADKGTKHELTKEFVQLVVEDERNIKSSNKMKINPLSEKNPRASTMPKVDRSDEFKVVDVSSKEPQHSKGRDSLAELKSDMPDNYLRQEHMGAAKRLFANALRTHRRDVNLSNKETGC
ncbi:uncharacterized protein LOC131005768 isoform X2 [Salvia miltiorrhiza]|uniref:uncharacterized protein LOC131005768 isoform X2 n=1 Tax=Salvia miltiorrhiza TaxID=226208 RepID=UPI0025ABD947|nr:uncharacterized protein LOC131005768 isoform X2 [Salvia miltiorrhiza]